MTELEIKQRNCEKSRRYRLRHPERVRECDKRHYWKYRERELAKMREYREKNRGRLQKKREYNRDKSREYYLRYYATNRLRVRARGYNISAGALGLMELQQQSRCAVCGRTESRVVNGLRYSLAVDHNHTTGVVRELLCRDCNRGIGHFKDDPKLLRAAADYLESHNHE